MKRMKKLILANLLSRLVLLTTCGQKASLDQRAGDNKIRLRVSPVPHKEIIKALEPEFRKAGLDVEVTIFDDYIISSLALDQGDLSTNFFQHAPYLDDFIRERGVELTNLRTVHLEPIGFYPDRYKSVGELKDGGEVLIPNDATNGGRALILLEKAGVVKLNDPNNLAVTGKDVTEDPKDLKFTALDTPSIPRSYKEIAGAVINSNYTSEVGLDPARGSLLTEDKDSPYTSIIAARQEEEGQEKFKKFMEVLHSEVCRKFIEETCRGAVVPAF